MLEHKAADAFGSGRNWGTNKEHVLEVWRVPPLMRTPH